MLAAIVSYPVLATIECLQRGWRDLLLPCFLDKSLRTLLTDALAKALQALRTFGFEWSRGREEYCELAPHALVHDLTLHSSVRIKPFSNRGARIVNSVIVLIL